jgi:hypothetical protein
MGFLTPLSISKGLVHPRHLKEYLTAWYRGAETSEGAAQAAKGTVRSRLSPQYG